jgi:probable HAF family extracellular repeat protein
MKTLMSFIAVLLILFCIPEIHAATFQGIGDLPGGTFDSRAYAVSADGLVVIGSSRFDDGQDWTTAFRWRDGVGIESLISSNSYTAYDVSADGSVLAVTPIGADNASHYSRPIYRGRLPSAPKSSPASAGRAGTDPAG